MLLAKIPDSKSNLTNILTKCFYHILSIFYKYMLLHLQCFADNDMIQET